MKDFLSLVLPSEGAGKYISWNGQNKRTQSYGTLDDLAAGLKAIDESGGTAYFAVGAFSGGRRVAEEATAKRAFYLDIDFKNCPPEDPSGHALTLLRQFSKKYGLGAPTYMMSTGGGIHVYWALDADVEPGMWRMYAEALKAAVKEFGVPADHAVTADVARILRPPQTLNRKYDPPYRTEGRLLGRVYPLAAFDVFLRGQESALNLTAAHAVLELPSATAKTYKKFWIQSIAESGECRLVHWALQPSSQTPDQMSEALWSDLLAMCSQAEDGNHFAHEFSRHDAERYNGGDAVNAKIASWRGQQHPRTCATLAGHGKCGSCPHALEGRSPVRFGYTGPETSADPAADPSEIISRMLRQRMRQFYPGEREDFLDGYKPPVKWPIGYGFDPTNFQTLKSEMTPSPPDENGNPVPPRVERSLLWPGVFWAQHKLRNEQGVMTYEFVFWARPDEHPVRVTLEPSIYGSDSAVINLLMRYGFPLASSRKKQAVDYFAKCMDMINTSTRDSLMLESLGWDAQRSLFNFGASCAVKNHGVVEIRPALASKRITEYGIPIGARGSLETWKEAVATYDAPGCERYQFCLVAGFASVLIPLTTQRWSHLLHIYSDASGSGKTSLQQAIWSIWGPPELDKGRSTYNALLDRFSAYGNLPGLVDEITLFDAATLRRLAMDVAAGEPRARLTQTGSRVVHGKNWQLIGVSSGNVDIEYEMGRGGNSEGEWARITSVALHGNVLQRERQQTFQQIQQNYGLAGPVFVTRLMERGLDAVKQEILAVESELAARFAPTESLRGSLRFKLATFACIKVAARLAIQCGLVPYNLSAIDSVTDTLLTHAAGAVGDPSDNIVRDITTFLSSNSAVLPRMVRTATGQLSMAQRFDGVLSRDVTKLGNNARADRTDAFIVVNDSPVHSTAALPLAQRPALYFTRSVLDDGRKKLFTSVRTDPLQTVPERLRGSQYSMDIVHEVILGMRMEFIRILLPRDMVDVSSLAPAENRNSA